MDKNEILKLKVSLLYSSEISGAYVQYCTIKAFFENEYWKEKRLLSAQIEGAKSSRGSYIHSTGPR